jgi:hypothetical protein
MPKGQSHPHLGRIRAGAASQRQRDRAADAAVKGQRQLERVYRNAASALREVVGRRELPRRLSRISEALIQVADRVW